jgi:hypothetical protein
MQNASRLSRLEINGSVPEISAAAKDAPTELRDFVARIGSLAAVVVGYHDIR